MQPQPLVFPFATSSSPSPIRASLALSAEEEAQMVQFLQELVRTPSCSAQEETLAKKIVEQLSAFGIEDVSIDPIGNVIARLGDELGPTLLYDAHMDTVDAASTGWTHDPHAAIVENGTLYGLGACDTKGSIAAMVFAAKRLVETGCPLHGNLILAFVVQEEPCEGAALKALLERGEIRPDWTVLGEPSDLAIMRGHRGRVLFRIHVKGKSSHGACPELGRNAITAAARLIFGIDLLASELSSDPFLGSGTIAVTQIESTAPSMNAIPDTCVVYVDRRLTLGETATRAQAQLEAVIQREDIDAEVEIVEYRTRTYTGYEIQRRESFNAWVLNEKHPIIQELGAAIRAVSGSEPRVGRWAFSTDGVYSMGEANIPTVGFGPGKPEYAHTVQDQVKLSDVTRASHVYALLASKLLGGS